MEFDKSRVYTSVNAEELEIGTRCYFADNLKTIRLAVEGNDFAASATVAKLVRINDEWSNRRFHATWGGDFFLAYPIPNKE